MPSNTRRKMSVGYETETDCSEAVSPHERTIMETYMWAGMSFHSSDIHSKKIYEI